MHTKIATSIFALTVAFLPLSAHAADLGHGSKDSPASVLDAPVSGAALNWTGFYIGAHGGYGNANHELTVDETFKGEDGSSETHNLIDLNGINSRGFVGGVDGGFDFSRAGWVFGVLGGYTWSGMESELSLFDGEADWKLSKKNEWYAGARAGRVVAPRTLLYLLAAYVQSDYDLTGTGIKDKVSETYKGVKVGGGFEYAVANNLFLGLEYTHDFYRDQDWVKEDGIKVTDSLDEDKAMLTLKFKLNSGLPSLGF